MDDNSTRLLHYGHLGKAVYHPDTQSWEFSRTLASPPRISYTGVTKTAVQSPLTSIEQSFTVKKSTLSRGYPELIAGFRFARSETLSHIITTASEACDPLVSSLLDFGRAVDLDNENSGRRAVPVVAFASGECGNTISFRVITDDEVELEQAATVQLHIPTIGDTDTLECLADGTPLRQICFAQSLEERATFMAARYSCSTAIFRPLYRRSSVSVPTHRDSNGIIPGFQTSRLDPNFLLEISTSHTGGIAHADIRFNPWNQKQFAIVAEDGNWGIWELRNQNRRNKDNWVAACVISGSLPWVGATEGQDSGAQVRHDGWLAIEWVGDEHHVIVCDRRCSMLYRMEGNRTYSYSIELGFKRRSEWILGIRRSTCNSSHVFILTTTRLLWLDVDLESLLDHQDSRPTLYPRISWRHFRDSDDTTLQLTSLAVDDDFYLVVFSRLNRLVLAFHCSDSASAPDPFILEVPSSSEDAEEPETSPGDTCFSTLVLKEVAPTAMGENYHDPTVRLLKIFAVYSDLRVRESLFWKPSNGDSEAERLHGRDVLRVKNLRLTGQRTRAVHLRGDFVVDDWDESAVGPGENLGHGINSIVPLADPQRTFDFTQIYAIATGALSVLSLDSQKAVESSFRESLKELVDKISSNNTTDHSISQTALELLRKTPALDDIDQNGQDLGAFISQFASNSSALGGQYHILVQPFDSLSSPLARRVNPVEPPKLDLVAIYDHLVNNWLVNLPLNIPGRARIAKEKAIRVFVADLTLAQIISAHKSSEGESDEHSTHSRGVSSLSSRSGLITLSATADEQSSSQPPVRSVDQGFSSQASNTFTQGNPALGDDIFPEPQAESCSAFTALSSYTTFNRPTPTSRDAGRILDHWKPGVNPASYTLASEESRLAAKLTASRRKSRKQLPQAMKTMSLDSSIPLPVSSPTPVARNWGSQPDNNSQPPMMLLQSSQVTVDLPMTQIERGAFGGREPSRKSGMKAKKKKRAAGF